MQITTTSAGLTADVTIGLPHGLHSRPSAKVAQAARNYDADIQLIAENGEVSAKSMLDLLSLALQANDPVRICASGPQAKEALLEIARLLTQPGD